MAPPKPVPDSNGLIAGLLRDLAAVQTERQKRWGYSKAADAVANLTEPVASLLQPDGTLRKIPGVGPSSTRVILEVLRTGTSPTAGRFRVIKGIEANVLADGSLDMTPEERGRLELVVAAPHSALRSTADQTARLLRAVETPGVHILGHPRGRKYGVRPGLSADWDRVFAAAARATVAIEIDGDPRRQDIDHRLAPRALQAGCLFALDSDAHATGEWAFAETAVAHARLARIPAERVINCWPVEFLLEWAAGQMG